MSAERMGRAGTTRAAGPAIFGRRIRCCWAVALAGFACNSEPEGEVRLATWWGQRGEFVAPFETLKQSLFDTSGLDVRIVTELTSKGYHMQWVDTQLDPRTESPAALDVVAYNNGGDVQRWTPCAGSQYRPATPRLRAVDDPALGPLHLETSWIEDSFDDAVLRTLKCGDHYYALPVGLHQINTLFFNKRLLRAAGYDVDQDGTGELPLPSSLDELETAAGLVAAQLPAGEGDDGGVPVFALPRSDSWTLSLFFIENVMLASATEKPYESYWRATACDAGLLARALERIRNLKPYFGSKNLGEKDALQEVIVGNSAMLVTGDWAAAGLDPNEVGHIAFPGTQHLFVFTADVFAMPDLATSDAQNGLAWLRAVTGLDTQREFARRKHALSARRDDPEREPRRAWVPSLPAFLPGTELDAPSGYEEPFESLSTQLQDWLEPDDASAADAALLQYATQECERMRAGGPEPTRDVH